MTFQVVDKWNDMDFGGSGLVGEIVADKQKLINLLGEPIPVDGARIEYRWLIKFEDGTCATIFKDRQDKEGVYCVGGFGHYDKKTKENLSLRAVKELLNL